jgi:hypothetical protein
MTSLLVGDGQRIPLRSTGAVSIRVSSYEAVLRRPGARFVPLDRLTVDLIMTWPAGPESPYAAWIPERTHADAGHAAASSGGTSAVITSPSRRVVRVSAT